MKLYETVTEGGGTIAAEWSLKAAKAAGRAHGGEFVVWRSIVNMTPREAFRAAVKGGGYADETEVVYESVKHVADKAGEAE
jgi:hypothetical protein